MSEYNLLERKLAKLVSQFPGVKRKLKSFYQELNLRIHGEKGFEYSIHNELQIATPSTWAGISESVEANREYFGYYDKSPWSKDMKKYLVHRINESNESLLLTVYDKESASCQELEESRVWSSQQATMAQWVTLDERQVVIFNTSENGVLGAKVRSESDFERFYEWPVQAINPQNSAYLSINYNRVYLLCPEYGCSKQVGSFAVDSSDKEDGLFLIDIQTGNEKLLVTYEELSRDFPIEGIANGDCELNHCLFSPSGTKFVFMQRWKGKSGRCSRLFVYCMKANKVDIVLDEGMVSHYSWKNDEELVLWARTVKHGECYYRINVDSKSLEIIGEGILDKFGDGHPSYSPCGKWLVTDTYPDRASQQHLLLFNLESSELIELGRFFQPKKFRGASRCDLHPRWSRDGKYISIDSSHTGYLGNYILDISILLTDK